jgi:ankyrin repeat protein
LQNGLAALHTAAQNGHKEIVALLLESGADFEAKDQVKRMSVAFMVAHIFIESLFRLFESFFFHELRPQHARTPVHYAAEGGHRKIVSLLLEKGADIEAQDLVLVHGLLYLLIVRILTAPHNIIP